MIDQILGGAFEPGSAMPRQIRSQEAEHRRMLEITAELENRKVEALKIYEPTPLQQQFHACTAKEVLLSGGNRGGKSVAAFVELARAVTEQDPFKKYPTGDVEKLAVVLGYKQSHIGMVIHKYLFRPGRFRMIKDLETGEWRSYRPWNPEDVKRYKQSYPAPPLIPKRFIKRIAWVKKSENIFKRVEFTTGWELYAFPSTSSPDQGFAADLALIDEDILNESWYNELVGRLGERDGKLRWSAMPHNDNDAMELVGQRAEEELAAHEAGGPEPSTVAIELSMLDNPFISDKAKNEATKRWAASGPEEYNRRVYGRRNSNTVRMYPTWSEHIHDAMRYVELCPLFKEVKDTGRVPFDWTKTMLVDPGHRVCAVLFIATPPPDSPFPDFRLAYRELYLQQATGATFADAVRSVTQGETLQRFIIDMHGASLTDIASGETPLRVYERELDKHGVYCDATGVRFVPGCDSIEFREETLRAWLEPRPENGMPMFVAMRDFCPNLFREMKGFKKKKVGNVITDQGNRKANTHLVETLEYASADKCPYLHPKKREFTLTPAAQWIAAFKQREQQRRWKNGPSSKGIPLGPVGSK